MAFERIFELNNPPQSGRVGLFLPDPVTFGQIFDGTPQFYAGSTILVQEQLTIISSITIGREHLVDVDQRWFDPKQYLGTYQVRGGIDGNLALDVEKGEGFITNTSIQLYRYSNYTIVANPNAQVSEGDIFTVDNCNFGTQTISLNILGAQVSVQKPITDRALFSGNISKSKAPLADGRYNQLLNNIGLFYNPGCESTSVRQNISVINAIATDYANYPSFQCSPIVGE